MVIQKLTGIRKIIKLKINKKDIENFVNSTIENNKLNKINNNLYLSNNQINILKKYKIDYMNSTSLQSLIFKIEIVLNNNYGYTNLDDLENLSRELSEFNYYYNTNK